MKKEYKLLIESQDKNCNIDFKELHPELENSTNLLKYAIKRLRNEELEPKNEVYTPKATGTPTNSKKKI